MDPAPESEGLRAYIRAGNRVVRWFLWGGIALLGTAIALMVGLTLLPDSGFPDPEAEVLRGIRAVRMEVVINKSAERCGIDRDEIAAAAKAAIGQSSFRIIESPNYEDGSLIHWVHGASATDSCVLLVQWYLHGAVLSKKDRRDSYATLAFGTTMVEYPPRDTLAGKSLVADYVGREMRELTRRWSRVNTSR